MKKIIFLFILFLSFVAQAQFNNQRQQRVSQQSQVQQKAPKPNFDVKKYLRIIVYDIEKYAKKSKVKLSSEKGKQFSKILTNYNREIKDISRINSFTFRETKNMVESFQKSAMKTGDFSGQIEVQKKMIENLKPVAETIKEEDKKLNKAIKSLLSEKQYKKWIKYNRKKGKFFSIEKEE
ncbi:hypothetical protein [uncultured Polaribacter sp.]|uniref:hypothetical protein n=1 Tax=uncultured Polaribacter sp. TaxID=174711 RepID=UPI00260E00A4|nr:hypothetical protein [uncultured Polaribacter sp.]